MKYIKSFLLVLTLSMFLGACSGAKSDNSADVKVVANANASPEAKPTGTIDEMAAARTIYKTNCAKCHKDDGSGGKVEIDGVMLKSEDLTSDKMKKMDDDKYIKYITKGIVDEGMPAFEDKLSEQEIKDVVKFVRAEFQK